MVNEGTFSMKLTILVSSPLAETEILLLLHSEQQTVQAAFHISGFPRKLQEDYPGKSSYREIAKYSLPLWPALQLMIYHLLSGLY